MPSNTDSEIENFSDCDSDVESTQKTIRAAEEILKMKAEFLQKNKSKTNFGQLKSQLHQTKLPPKRSERLDQKKDLDNYYKELQNQIASLQSSLDVFHKCFTSIFDNMEKQDARITELEYERHAQEERVSRLEKQVRSLQSKKSKPDNYATAVQTANTERINKMEIVVSEEERKKHLNDVLITHSDLAPDPVEKLDDLLRNTLGMENREIDANMQVKRMTRPNTVRITFSDKRFKTMLYKARKRLRTVNERSANQLYINDHLTNYNYRILMDLKKARKRYNCNQDPFQSIYNFEGRIFIKLKENAAEKSQHIRTHEEMMNLIASLPTASRETVAISSSEPTSAPQAAATSSRRVALN